MNKKIAIIGAGLSGLAAALELKKLGHQIKVFDQSVKVGGRVQSDHIDGYTLDRGFQVLLPSYEMAQHYFDYEDLKLSGFQPGAQIYNQSSQKFNIISDPLRDPSTLLVTVFNSVASLKDKYLILKLKLNTKNFEMKSLSNTTTYSGLKEFGFSDKFINGFLKPFFSGVFLEKELSLDFNFFKYLFSKFNSSQAVLPLGGMGALSEQMAKSLSQEELKLGIKVESFTQNSVQTQNAGEKFDHVICAMGQDQAQKVGGLKLKAESESAETYRPVVTSYFTTPSEKHSSKYLYLLPGHKVNHVACLTAVQKSYAPKGQVLYSVNSIESEARDPKEIIQSLVPVFGETEMKTWSHLKTYEIKKALPKNFLNQDKTLSQNGILYIGDYTQHPSIQGALESGYKCAQEIKK